MARKLVIIGGDAAGMSAAAQARRLASADALEIVAFERGARTSYAACGLPYLIGGLVETPDRLVARTPEQHRANGIDIRIRHEVTAIDTKASMVTVRDLDTGRDSVEHFDELLIATGATGVSPKWPGITAKGVLQLRTLDDAAEVERRLDAGARRAVVVGAGYIGLEVAEGLLARGLAVTVIGKRRCWRRAQAVARTGSRWNRGALYDSAQTAARIRRSLLRVRLLRCMKKTAAE